MPTDKSNEYASALGSVGENLARRAFLELGRYHGFDAIEAGAGGNIPIKLTHSTPLQYVNSANTKIELAVFITGHGVVVTTDDEPTVEVLVNASGGTRYQVIYASYTWVNAPGGSSVSYTTGAVLSVKPSTQPVAAAELTPLGYCTIIDGATTIAGVTYTAYDKPNLAKKTDLDLSPLATLAGPNKFTGMNTANAVSLSAAALVDNGEVGFRYDLTIPETGNVFSIAELLEQDYIVDSIKFSGAKVPEEGEILYIQFAPSGGVLYWGETNITKPVGFETTALANGATFIIQYVDGSFHIVGMVDTLKQSIAILSGRVTTVEEAINTNAEGDNEVAARVKALEDATYLIMASQVMAADGHVELNNGLIIQWASFYHGDIVSGTEGSDAVHNYTKAFPKAFASDVYQVLLSVKNVSTQPKPGIVRSGVALYATTLGGFTYRTEDFTPDGYVQDVTIVMIAIGK